MLEGMSADEIVFHTFEALRRIFIGAENIADARKFDQRFLALLTEVAAGDIALFPGIAEISLRIENEARLTPEEREALAKSLHVEMRLDKEIASRLLAFIER